MLENITKSYMLENITRQRVLIVCCIAILFILQLVSRPLVYTGDEPRYVHMAASIFERGDLGISFEEWKQFADRMGLPSYSSPKSFVFIHSPIHSFLTAPFVGNFGPNAGRWVGFVVAIFAFLATVGLARQAADSYVSIFATLLLFSTIPLFSYSRSLYTEIWLVALFSGAWYFLHLIKYGRIYKTIFLILSLSLPFFHLRMSLVSAGLIFVAAIMEFKNSAVKDKRQALRSAAFLIGIAAISAIGLVVFQLWLTGSIMGTTIMPLKPTLAGFFERIAVQLLTLRHGLFVFNPVMICSVVGLVTSALLGNQFAKEGILFALLYLVTFVFGAASESSPARFWVAIMPIFNVGLVFWIRLPKPWWATLITILLAIVSIVNVSLYIIDPNIFIQNREVSISYDKLYDYIPIFYFSHLLPWDTYFFHEQGFNSHFDVSHILLVRAIIFTLSLGFFLLLAVRFRSYKWICRVSGIIVLAYMLYVLWLAWLCEVPKFSMLTENTSALAGVRDDYIIKFASPIQPKVLRFIDTDSYWNESDYPDMFDVDYDVEGKGFLRVGSVPAGHIVTLPSGGPTGKIRLTAKGGTVTSSRWQGGRISVLAKTCPQASALIWSPIPVGKRILFGSDEEGIHYLDSGWSIPEPWGVWSDGSKARLSLVVEKAAARNLRLEIEAGALVSPSHPKQDVEIRINGVLATTVSLVRASGNHIEVPVPASVWEALEEHGELYLQFKFADAVSPKDIGMNRDTRPLALGLIAITVTTIQ